MPFIGLVAKTDGQTKRLSWENVGEYLTEIRDANQMESLILLFHKDLDETKIGVAGISDILLRIRSQKETWPFVVVDERLERPTIKRGFFERDGVWLAHFLCVEDASVVEKQADMFVFTAEHPRPAHAVKADIDNLPWK